MKRNTARLTLHGSMLLLGIFTLVGTLAGCTPAPTGNYDSQREVSASPVAPNDPQSTETGELPPVSTTVVRVIDGDTVALAPVLARTDDDVSLKATNAEGTEHVVRLLGIDTPEMNYSTTQEPDCGAQQATDHLETLLPEGTQVTLTYDPLADKTDRYGRSLAYLSTESGEDVALEQAMAGYAAAWYPRSEPEPENYKIYRSAQKEAELNLLGSFGTCNTIGR